MLRGGRGRGGQVVNAHTSHVIFFNDQKLFVCFLEALKHTRYSQGLLYKHCCY